MRPLLLTLLLLTSITQAQFTLQQSHTTASLRGIHSLGNGIAWASGTNGTVLRTTDQGKTWQTCPIPPNAEKLDFRGIQAFDANTAIVMSSGTGDLSRLYKTTNACQSWTLIATNPDKEGFWDSIQAQNDEEAVILGDSVEGQLRVWEWKEGWEERELELSYQMKGAASRKEGSFAASNSVLQIVSQPQIDPKWNYELRFTSETADHAWISMVRTETGACEPCRLERLRVEVPMSQGTSSAGVFSFAFRDQFSGVAVGGDYMKPVATIRTAATTKDAGNSWQPAQTSPHGYRSSVAYAPTQKLWITVGPNGTDISTDDGRNWQPLRPNPTDAPDSDKNWNALSLPFVVGPQGRIGLLEPIPSRGAP